MRAENNKDERIATGNSIKLHDLSSFNLLFLLVCDRAFVAAIYL